MEADGRTDGRTDERELKRRVKLFFMVHRNSLPLLVRREALNDSGKGPNNLSDLKSEPLRMVLLYFATWNLRSTESLIDSLFVIIEAMMACPDL